MKTGERLKKNFIAVLVVTFIHWMVCWLYTPDPVFAFIILMLVIITPVFTGIIVSIVLLPRVYLVIISQLLFIAIGYIQTSTNLSMEYIYLEYSNGGFTGDIVRTFLKTNALSIIIAVCIMLFYQLMSKYGKKEDFQNEDERV